MTKKEIKKLNEYYNKDWETLTQEQKNDVRLLEMKFEKRIAEPILESILYPIE